jgi:uncharacterized protein (TIGR02117 family)
MIIRKTIKYLLRFILFFICFVLLYMLSAYCLARISVNAEPNTKQEVGIYIKTNGVHTDIVVPVTNEQLSWDKEVKYDNTVSTDTSYHYLGMGWGDKGFYLETPTWGDLTAKVAFKAAFALSTTAIHATFYKTLNENDSCRKIMISSEQYSRLIKYITNSFQKDKNGHFIRIITNANYGKNDAFYEANGSYSMLHTCNTWANNGLKSCGQKACLWTPFDTGIFLKYNHKN